MSIRISPLIAVAVLLGSFNPAQGQDPLITPGDFIIAFDLDVVPVASSYPEMEGPANLLDLSPGTKYLNFAGPGSGFIATPSSGANILQSFLITTANDAPDRDPASWEVYGTNAPIVTLDNATAESVDDLAENWTLVDSGTVALPDERETFGPFVHVDNTTAYSSYLMTFPTLKGAAAEMQLGDIEFFDNQSEDFSGSFLQFGDAIQAVYLGSLEPMYTSDYPGERPDAGLGAETPGNAIDLNTDTKYLNFGEVNSGLIFTPSVGPSVASGLQITTANDAVERDPTMWELYGTNEPIMSEDNSDGSAENWSLISSGDISLSDDRFTPSEIVNFDNETPYESYRFVVTGVKDVDAANSMQLAEFQLFGTVSMGGGGIPGDYNNSGLVEQGDLDLVLGFWGSDANDVPATWENDPPEGFVDQAELDKVLGNWGAQAAGLGTAAGVPEPSTVVLLALAAALGLWQARRRPLMHKAA